MMKLLSKISDPQDLKNKNFDELNILANEIRNYIIEVLSKNGGHLASNLGSVELTIALHTVFNSPEDKFIFDTSHQTYTHKILTNRKNDFPSLRTYMGLSGFAHKCESKHDHFSSGHAGTAISIALGLAKRRDFLSKDDHIIPIIGDGSLTCGLTLEALNNISHDTKNFITILNDNKMAISHNVGNIKNILSRLINNPLSNKIYQDIKALITKVPYGDTLARQGQKVLESLKNLVSQAPFFEQLGISYIGPIDGHDIKKMVETFTALKNLQKPVIVHLLTQKGKGLNAAVENPTSYHGVVPFDKISGEFLPAKKITPNFCQIFADHLIEMAKKDPTIVAISPAMLSGSKLIKFKKYFPDRCFDVGIAEGHAITFSAGLAFKSNLKVVTNI